MGQWLDIKGPVVADTVYSGGVLVAKDVTFTLPGIEFLTADVQAMGNLTVPLIGLLENMELAITKIGVDMGLPSNIPEISVEVGSATEAEITYNITRQQIYANGTEYMCVDRLSQILRINGKDYMAAINSLL